MPDAESTRTFSRVTQLGLPSRGTAGGDSFSRSPGSQKSETRLRARRLCPGLSAWRADGRLVPRPSCGLPSACASLYLTGTSPVGLGPPLVTPFDLDDLWRQSHSEVRVCRPPPRGVRRTRSHTSFPLGWAGTPFHGNAPGGRGQDEVPRHCWEQTSVHPFFIYFFNLHLRMCFLLIFVWREKEKH